jgi:hypothetical protein
MIQAAFRIGICLPEPGNYLACSCLLVLTRQP